jgi:hypothetical protein
MLEQAMWQARLAPAAFHALGRYVASSYSRRSCNRLMCRNLSSYNIRSCELVDDGRLRPQTQT